MAQTMYAMKAGGAAEGCGLWKGESRGQEACCLPVAWELLLTSY